MLTGLWEGLKHAFYFTARVGIVFIIIIKHFGAFFNFPKFTPVPNRDLFLLQTARCVALATIEPGKKSYVAP